MKLHVLKTNLNYVNKIISNIPLKLYFKNKENIENIAFFLCDIKMYKLEDLSYHILVAKSKFYLEDVYKEYLEQYEISFDELALLYIHNILDKSNVFDKKKIFKGFYQDNKLNMKLYYSFDNNKYKEDDIYIETF